MKYGADPNKKNNNLWAPIHMACYFNQVEALKWVYNYNKTCLKMKYIDLNC